MIKNTKRKEVILDVNTIELLELQAKKQGRKLKNYMEQVLIEKANDFQLTDEYKQMMDIVLNNFDNNTIDFKNWETVRNNLK